MHRTTHREGFALGLTLVLIVVIGALIAGAFWTSTQDYRTSRNGIVQERALNAAEYGQNWVLANFNGPVARAMAIGDTVSWNTTAPDGESTATVRMTRLNVNTFWLVSEGWNGSGAAAQARRRTNLILRLDTPNIRVAGALTSAGPFAASGSGQINANDIVPTGWTDCPPGGADRAAVANDNPGTEVTGTGTNCSGFACFHTSVSPKVVTDPAAGQAATYNNFGGLTWADLRALALANYSSQAFTSTGTAASPMLVPGGNPTPSLSGTACATAVSNNWGEPSRPSALYAACEDFYPIIYITGPTAYTRLAGNGRGQGMLLVEGNLELAGNFLFSGLIIVQGNFKIAGTGGAGTGAKVIGAVMAAGTNNVMAGNSNIQYSSCAIAQALASQNPPPVPAIERSWADMY